MLLIYYCHDIVTINLEPEQLGHLHLEGHRPAHVVQQPVAGGVDLVSLGLEVEVV